MAAVLLCLPLNGSSLMISNFNLEKAVCSHGFFMMAPNVWDQKNKILTRPLRLLSDPSISLLVSISQPSSSSSFLRIRVIFDDKTTIHHKSLSAQDQQHLVDQVARMLRISEKDETNIIEFQKINPNAKKRGFGRVFRSPTIFEDMVKSILLSNCGWSRSLDMAKALCELQLELKRHHNSEENTTAAAKSLKTNKKKKRQHGVMAEDSLHRLHYSDHDDVDCHDQSGGVGDFPRPSELAKLDEEFLGKRCNLGYRARAILDLARKFEASSSSSDSPLSSLSGNSNNHIGYWLKRVLDDVDQPAENNEENKCYYYEKVYKELLCLKGFGPFVCSYVLTCMGFYERIPADTETVRHFKEIHGRKSCTRKTVTKDAEEIYGEYAPFQFLAYWSEIWEFYENKFGKMSELPPENYRVVTGSFKPAQSSSSSSSLEVHTGAVVRRNRVTVQNRRLTTTKSRPK